MTVLDLGSNIDRLGMWSADRDWTDYFWNPPKVGNPQPAPVKECPNCESILPARVMVCNFCGYEYPEPEGKDLAEGELVEVVNTTEFVGRRVSQLDEYQLSQAQKHYKWSLGFVTRVLRSKGDKSVAIFAKIRGYSAGWVWRNKQGAVNFYDFVLK